MDVIAICCSYYLRAGVLVGDIIQATELGTPQGSPLSPLLANILLDDLDKESGVYHVILFSEVGEADPGFRFVSSRLLPMLTVGLK